MLIQLSFIFLMNGFGVWIYFMVEKDLFLHNPKVYNDTKRKRRY